MGSCALIEQTDQKDQIVIPKWSACVVSGISCDLGFTQTLHFSPVHPIALSKAVSFAYSIIHHAIDMNNLLIVLLKRRSLYRRATKLRELHTVLYRQSVYEQSSRSTEVTSSSTSGERWQARSSRSVCSVTRSLWLRPYRSWLLPRRSPSPCE